MRRSVQVARADSASPERLIPRCASSRVLTLGGDLNVGQLTVWTSDPSPSPIEVIVDGVAVGLLTAYRKSAPVCGSRSAGAVSVSRPPGRVVLSATETEGTGRWPPMAVELHAGRCQTIELRP